MEKKIAPKYFKVDRNKIIAENLNEAIVYLRASIEQIEKAKGRLISKKRKEKRKSFVTEMTLLLEGCQSHPNGCYIRFRNSKIEHSEPRHDVVIDYDKDGNIVGIEFYMGLELCMKR